MLSSKDILLFLLATFAAIIYLGQAQPTPIELAFENQANQDIIVYWKNTFKQPTELVKFADLRKADHGVLPVSSYQGHTFVFSSVNERTPESIEYTVKNTPELVSVKYDDEFGLLIETEVYEKENLAPLSDLDADEDAGDRDKRPKGTNLKITNNCSLPLDVYWLNSEANVIQLITRDPLAQGESTSMLSYEGHVMEFVIQPDNSKVVQAQFVKGAFDESIYINLDNNGAISIGTNSEYEKFADDVNAAIANCDVYANDPYSHKNCLTDQIFEEYDKISKTFEDISYSHTLVSNRLRNYTCVDDNLPTTPPLHTKTETLQGREYTVATHLDMPSAHIWTIPNFITDEECSVLMNSARNKLQRATVSGVNGESVLSPSRKAQQAGYDVRGPADPLWNLYHRVFEFTNKQTGYNLHTDGQEGFTIIQYNPTDEYIPHCDGSCDGEEHTPTGRVATAVLYCKVPARGGSTTFTKADVFVKPEAGAATFFAYMGPDRLMDIGFTEHSGCPVIDGEKWITTVWMRGGVSTKTPHTKSDPTGKTKLM